MGIQWIHIAPEAFAVASAEFPDQIDVWQNALPGSLKGKLESVREILARASHLQHLIHYRYSQLSGAKILLINDKDPWAAVDANALITGSFQAFGTRQNSYVRLT